MDIDNFKFINDHSGHSAGDHLLKTVAYTVLKNIRNIDIAARFGGDEFGILLSETDANGARKLAEKLNQKLTTKMREHDWPVTFSMGVATFQDISGNIEDMLNTADKLMYLAKKNGKNRILHQIILDRKTLLKADNCFNRKEKIFNNILNEVT
jgi:diguanylate cyclase (GGDEF)-like protein